MGFIWIYHLVLCYIAMENPVNKWRYIAGKILYKTPKICHGLLTFSNEQVLANRYLYYLLFAKEFTFNPTFTRDCQSKTNS